jgi:glycosidase
LESLLQLYPRENAYAMYVPLGSHDTERIMTKLEGSLEMVKLAFLFQFAFPGAPAVYYGDEMGVRGGKDPECRGTFPWDEGRWNQELLSWVKGLISLRKRHAALRRGNFTHVLSDDRRRAYAFSRQLGDESVLVVINASSTKRNLRLPVSGLNYVEGQILRDLLSKSEYLVSGGNVSVSLPPRSGIWLV